MRRTHSLACAGLALFTILASGGLEAAAPDPCVLVSKADAEKLADTPLRAPVGGPGTCVYGAPPKGRTASVEVYIGDPAQRYLDIERSIGRKFRTLSGVGDEAFVSDATALLFIKKSDLLVAVRYVTLSDEAEYRKRFEDLARVIAGRI